MDLSWVKNLADQSNQQELARQERQRREKEDARMAALATCPFVEKLHVVIDHAAEEFNKHCMFPHLRIQTTRLYKHSKDGPDGEPDEVAYFSFSRLGYMFGIRGINGCVEFLQIPVGDSTISVKLHELPISATKRLVAEIEPETRKVRWTIEGHPMDAQIIGSLCQRFFIELIETTNAEIK